MKKFSTALIFIFTLWFSIHAQVPTGYYDAANGKSGEELKSALFQIIKNYISADYDGFTANYWGSTYFTKTDWNSSGYVWDMYSNEQRANYNSSLMSREHCMPRSWWGNSSDYGVANSDLNNLYPADYTANSKKSNLPLGEVGVTSWTNSVVKIGSNTYPGYTGTVFEPADEYKGDFARTYFYMVTAHQDYADRWKNDGTASMLDNNTYPVFKTWAINMLLDWARKDPVSQKEIDRNNAVFAIQQNRNPFIDFPDLFEYIWGNKTSETLSISNLATSPNLITPTNGTSVNFGQISVGGQKTKMIPVKSTLLSGDLSLSWDENASGYFSISKNSISENDANSASGDTLNILYSPLAEGTHTAKLRIANSVSGLSSVINITASATNGVVTVDPVTPGDDTDVIFFYTGPWSKESLPAYLATNSTYAPYSNGDFKFGANNNYLTATFDQSPDYMQFAMYPRNVWGTNANHLYVYEGTSLSTLDATPIADFDNTFLTTGDTYTNSPEIHLKETTRAIKILYSKVSQNVGITNLFVTLKSSTGIAENSSESAIQAFSSNGVIYVKGIEKPTIVEIFNIFGKSIYTNKLNVRESSIPIYKSGIYIVKIGAKAFKVSL